VTGYAFDIKAVRTAGDLAAAIALFRAYAASLDVDLAYQGFEAEMAGMPGAYAPPRGDILLARDSAGAAIGAVALRPLAETVCEMKRLYVAPEGRGSGAGAALVAHLAAIAAAIGYREMRLDTLPSMHAAQALYRRLGFVEIAPYYDSPIAGTVFMARVLDAG